MTEGVSQNISEVLDAIYRSGSRRILATLIRLLGDFDVAEDGLHDAFRAALEQWPRDGVPANPGAWLVSTGRFKAIERLRRRARFDTAIESLPEHPCAATERLDESTEDDRLRLIFVCCHPALPPEARVALTLREVCGLTTEEIARAFLTTPPTLAQRIVRAKARIRDDRIPFEIPAQSELPERLGTVLQVIYLVFNEGYSASSGATLTRSDLSEEAIRLGRAMVELLPDPEVMGLLALMLLQESRRASRSLPAGELILLDDQDRSLWNKQLVAEGRELLETSARIQPLRSLHGAGGHRRGSHRCAGRGRNGLESDRRTLHIAGPPDAGARRRTQSSRGRTHEGWGRAGLDLIVAMLQRGELRDYHLAHSARADLCRKLEKKEEARASHLPALILVGQKPERQFLEKRLAELS